jgi:cytoskeleton protein RodZ
MKNTGRLLKEKRESANLSLSEVALATKINPKILAAIENAEEAALPAKTFLKGFIRSYAQFLKMDVDVVLRSFQEETGGPAVETIHEAYKKADSSPGASRRRVSEENSSGMRTAAVVVIVLLIGLIIGVREMIEKYQRERVVENSQALKVSPLGQPPIVVVPDKTTQEGSALPILPSPQAVPQPEGETELSNENAAPENPEKIASPAPPPPPAPGLGQSAPGTKGNVKNSIEKTVVPTAPLPTEASAPAAAKPGKREIIIEALDKVEVKFKVKGEDKTLSLGPTQVHSIHSDQPVTLEISDGGAVNIIVNGRDRGVPGDLGKPKTIKIP